MDPSTPVSHTINISGISQESFQEESLLSCIERKLEANCSSFTIYKAPSEINIEDRNVFLPAKVSIGPFHHGAPHLESVEKLKWHYLSTFLTHKPSLTLQDLIKLVVKSESRGRKCYEKEFYSSDRDEFSQIMLLDCCFILELLLRYTKRRFRRPNDPVFTTPGLLYDLRCDLVLLENQIPYFLLEEIYAKVLDGLEENMYLSDLTSRFFRTMVPGDRKFIGDNFIVEANHLLEMVYSCFLSTYPPVETNDKLKSKELPSASKLKAAGIKFKNARSSKSLLDIKFQNGVLEIPPLRVYQKTETILRNLAAYEICQFGTDLQVKSYLNFMSHLLQSDEDVKILCRKKILNALKDEEEQIIEKLKWIREQKDSLSGTFFAGIVQKLKEKPDRSVARWRRLRSNSTAISVATVLMVVVIFGAAFFAAFSVLQRRYK
ncbi:UPF0481 protein At3g47200 [Cucumis sativus]|uniref:Uncharacterized protein n=1 Tax=Cucumis sativus TaxID=3659 RepID=A0A0A0L821_CUCSA|nr:UPF0481 protein At3g47200 [Cucumis sativus]KGN57164.1 hypothetical protein Csa_011187 [Cucumis sativus]